MKSQNLQGKVCIVTGANSGIGRIVATSLANMGATLVMVCRKNDKPQVVFQEIKSKTKNPNIELLIADFSSQKEIRELAEKIKEKYKKIDVLINNAGGLNLGYTQTEDNIETTFAVNHLAPFLFTKLLLENLKTAGKARIINTASYAEKNATLDFKYLNLRNSYSAFKAYAQSKLCNILFTYELSRRLPSNITV